MPGRAVSGPTFRPIQIAKSAFGSAVPPFASARVRYLVKRIKGRTSVPVVAAVWDPSADRDRLAASFSEAGADRTVVTLADAVREVRALLGERARGSPPAASP